MVVRLSKFEKDRINDESIEIRDREKSMFSEHSDFKFDSSFGFLVYVCYAFSTPQARNSAGPFTSAPVEAGGRRSIPKKHR